MTELTLWPESSLAAIEETARRILCEVGVDVQSAAARELLLSAGCTLLPGGRVAVPWDVVERSAAAAPRRFTLAARDDARSLEVSSDGAATWAHPLGGAHSVVDAVTGELRRAQATDAAAAARVQHHLRRPDMVTPLFMPGDLPGDLEPLVSYLICLQETDKCVSGPPLWSVEQVQRRVPAGRPGPRRRPRRAAATPSTSPSRRCRRSRSAPTWRTRSWRRRGSAPPA